MTWSFHAAAPTFMAAVDDLDRLMSQQGPESLGTARAITAALHELPHVFTDGGGAHVYVGTNGHINKDGTGSLSIDITVSRFGYDASPEEVAR
jgi:hypothetical protein